MPIVPDSLKQDFLKRYPKANPDTLVEAAKRAGVINGGISQLRSLYAQELLDNGGHTAEAKVRDVFPEEGRTLIEQHYEDEGHSIGGHF